MTDNPLNPFPEGGIRPLYTTIGRPKPEGCYFDSAAADRAVSFIEDLRHTQGPLAGERFILAPEQRWVTREAFGWMRPDGTRLYRTCYVEEGRANGKSQWGAGVAGTLMYADDEANPEVVGAAKDRKQARIILNRLKAMIRTSPYLLKRTTLQVGEIRNRDNGGIYNATSSDVGGAWGGAPHGIVFDEVHAQPNRDLWDALVTGTGKRLQPMVWAFTTAGWDRESLCWELHEYTREIAEGTMDEPTFLGVVWAAAEDADWTLEETWLAANPMLEAVEGSGLTRSGARAAIKMEFMRREAKRAQQIPAFQNTFRTMYLSQWVGQEVRFMPMEAWDACAEPIVPGKRPAFGGLDLASTTDLAAFTVVSERAGGFDVDVKLFAPAEGVLERSRRDRVPYDVWAREGLLILTPGETIDQDTIKSYVIAAATEYDLRDVGYDRWNAGKLVQELKAEGLEMVEMGQGFASLSAPTKELLRVVLERKLRHGGHPILRWMANNTAAQTDAAGNIKPDKAKSTARIDGIVATIMALDGQMRRGRVAQRKSVYEDRGLTIA